MGGSAKRGRETAKKAWADIRSAIDILTNLRSDISYFEMFGDGFELAPGIVAPTLSGKPTAVIERLEDAETLITIARNRLKMSKERGDYGE